MDRHYVQFDPIGTMLSWEYIESLKQEVPERDPTKIQMPPNCSAFQFYDRPVTVVDGEEQLGNPTNFSAWYCTGRKITLKELKAGDKAAKKYPGLIALLEKNNLEEIIEVTNGAYVQALNGLIVI